MSLAYSPVSSNQYKMLNGQKKPKPIRRITGASSQTNDIYLIPYISEERYQDGHPSTSQKIEWTYDFGDINAEDILSWTASGMQKPSQLLQHASGTRQTTQANHFWTTDGARESSNPKTVISIPMKTQ